MKTGLNTLLDPTRRSREVEEFEAYLRRKVVGQDDAIAKVTAMYQTFLAGLNPPGRPVGNLLFLGPTGSGKTRVVEVMAEALFGEPRALLKIDCAEFQHSHEIAKLIGSPPGYLGHRETHPLLTQESLNQWQSDKLRLSLVLFDEIEKASDALWQLLLGILDKGTLTLGDNRRVDFSRTVVFMTGNLGAAEMSSILRPGLGFAAGETERAMAAADAKVSGKLASAGVEAARRRFTPEFMNRIDKTVVYRPLGAKELRRILAIELELVAQRIAASATAAPFSFELTPGAEDFLLREGTDMKYGARHLKRAIERELVHPLSNLIATGQTQSGDCISVDFDAENSCLTFSKTCAAAEAQAA